MKTAKQINTQLTGAIEYCTHTTNPIQLKSLCKACNQKPTISSLHLGMKRFELFIPHLPPSELMPNKLRTIHWGLRSKITTVSLNEAYLIIKSTLPEDWVTLENSCLTYEFTVKDKRRRDIDGLISACKPFLDSLVSSGVIQDDGCWNTYINGAWVVKGTEDSTRIIVEQD